MIETTHTNRLIHSSSPYLLQHAHNPVDWQPWDDAALAAARREDKPIFLSIGYSTCHWCHVMERESYEDEEVARILNENFISIKVDREERPDLDNVYMTAVQAMTGGGGWPLNVFLTPDLKPFYGGTYFPPEDRQGMAGFKRVLLAAAAAFRTRRGEMEATGEQVAAAIRQAASVAPGQGGGLGADLLDAAVREFRREFDAEWGGFGPAPKFPHAPALRLLMAYHQRTGHGGPLDMVTVTLDRMARGGMYDQLGGGFHRYSTDRRWLVPHFEKMLYDSALLAGTYLDAFQLTRRPLYERVARETLDYMIRDLAAPGGGFHSAQDADTEGEEGKSYVWTPAEASAVLGPADAELFSRYYDVTPEGNFEGKSILHVPVPAEEFAKRFGMTPGQWQRRVGEMRRKMLAARANRPAPGKDDKVLADWNGLAVSALARGWEVLGDETYRRAAERAAQFVLSTMHTREGLLHAYRGSKAHIPAGLDDYAYVAAGLVDLYAATLDSTWLAEAAHLADEMVERFWDREGGGFFETPAGRADLIARLKRGYDGALPNGGAVAALAMLKLAHLTDRRDLADKAEATLMLYRDAMERAPTAAAALLLALDFYLGPVQEVAVIGRADAPDTRGLLDTLRNRFLPRAVVAWTDPASADAAERARAIPLLKDRPMSDGRATAYVCENYACRRPVTSPEDLEKLLG